jgi:phosphohistidine phosphatase
MKTLYLLRHAKSSWDDADVDDFRRPLNDRGKQDAPRIGQRLRERGLRPALIRSSPADRAITTAKIVAHELGYPAKNIALDATLYLAEVKTLLAIVRGTPGACSSLMVVGHNPGLTHFANALTANPIDNLPTSGVVGISLNIAHWHDVRPTCGTLDFFEYPKALRE